MGIHVSFQVPQIGVLLFADVADAELVVGRCQCFTGGTVDNDALVTVVLLHPGEALVARIARVRAFPSMSPHVLLQRRRIDELLRAQLTTVRRRFAAVAQHVRLHVAALFEAALANYTDIRPIAGVFRHVLAQPIGTRVGPAANATTVRPFPGVTAKVFFQIAQLGERFRAHVAREGPFVAMRTHVTLKVRRVRELLWADLAAELVIASMCAHVFLQVGILCELALAYVARHLRTITHVGVEMALQRTGAAEPPLTNGTAKRLFARMYLHVLIQRAWVTEFLVTDNTL